MSYLLILLFQPGFPWHTYITLFIGYYASFAILLLVPIDIASVVVDRRSNTIGSDSNYTDNKNVLSTAYDAFFTIILILGSFVLVFEEYYNTDGKYDYNTANMSLFKFIIFVSLQVTFLWGERLPVLLRECV